MARKYSKRQSAEQLALGEQTERTALYIRVSTEKQVDEGYSLDAQQGKLLAHCHVHGWDVDLSHIYIDAGVSGKSTARPQFQAMVQAAQAGEIQRIVATKLDRLARNTSDFLQLVEQLRQHKCALVVLDLNIDTGTPTGMLVATVLASIAEWERKLITERVMSGKGQKAKEGGYNGSHCPLGYQYNGEQFLIVDDGAATVRTIFGAFVAGEGMLAIAQRLNDAGTPTAKGGQWYASTVQKILRNGFHAGLSQWDGVEVEGSHPAIISKELYEQAHTRLKNLRPGPEARG